MLSIVILRQMRPHQIPWQVNPQFKLLHHMINNNISVILRKKLQRSLNYPSKLDLLNVLALR